MGSGLTNNIRLVAPEYNSQSRIQRSEHPAPTEGASLTTCENDRHDPASLPTDSCATFPSRASLVIEIFCGVRRTLPRWQGRGLSRQLHGLASVAIIEITASRKMP